MPKPRRPADEVTAVTFDEIEQALGEAVRHLRSVVARGEATLQIWRVINSLLEWRFLITSVWLDYARRGGFTCTVL